MRPWYATCKKVLTVVLEEKESPGGPLMHTSLVRQLSLGAVIFCASYGTAHAVPITYDLAGTGSVCGALGGTCVSNVAFTGSVTLDVNPAGPAGSDSYVYDDGSTATAEDLNDWVISTYSFNWEGGTFSDRIVAGETQHGFYAGIYSDPLEEYLQTYNSSVRDTANGDTREIEINLGGLNLFSYDTSTRIFPDVTAFPSLTNLPAETPPWELDVTLFDYSFTEQGSTILTSSGYQAGFQVTSIVQRVASVPEPSTLALSIAGIAMLFWRRRKA
jgi:hypothetical protein